MRGLPPTLTPPTPHHPTVSVGSHFSETFPQFTQLLWANQRADLGAVTPHCTDIDLRLSHWNFNALVFPSLLWLMQWSEQLLWKNPQSCGKTHRGLTVVPTSVSPGYTEGLTASFTHRQRKVKHWATEFSHHHLWEWAAVWQFAPVLSRIHS